jgi:hypothetical protein
MDKRFVLTEVRRLLQFFLGCRFDLALRGLRAGSIVMTNAVIAQAAKSYIDQPHGDPL